MADILPVQEVMIEQGSALLLSVPENKPDAVLDALTGVFKRHKLVRRAFWVMAAEKNNTVPDEPVLLIVLELSEEQEVDTVIRQAAEAAMEHLADGEHIDFCLLNPDENDGLTHFLTQHTQAFYQRRLGGWLRNAIPVTEA
ncbi:enhanced serine sensitivity protein SseB C-terminal domain-containing protein [Morganella morganii]|uniref:enhanced serine sensitivity protein SseB C-terminal domain-containing protein n=1 Tax=Morganella morganii TaxID=582 RepID=UPI00164633B2|nr:enhanced serine sensitivity protein SseB C-terminal domain-containing protein [Morganella morganii]MBC4002460.1 enhanced serine sensitivity protein SseB C-terminal domain-containing protein [Morganella morganii]